MARLSWLAALALTVTAASPGVAQEPRADDGGPGWGEARASGPRWGAGADALFLAPRFESNPAYFVTRQGVPLGGPPANAQDVEEFRYGLNVSPRVWLSYAAESGWGGRVRWLHFDASADPREAVNPPVPLGSPVAFRSVSSTSPLMAISTQTSLPAVNSLQAQGRPGVEDRLLFTSSLRMDMIDAEATLGDLWAGAWSFELFGGVRYARIEQDYDAVSLGGLPQTLSSRQTFDGVGPSVGFGGRRRLGDTRLAAYGTGRIAFLFGTDEHVMSGVNVGLVPDFTYASHVNRSSRQRVLPVIEYEFGVEGVQPVGPAEAVVRVGVFTQLVPLGSGANGNGNAGLIGLSLGTGVRF